MNLHPKKPYIYAMLAFFGGTSLSILLFFLIFRYQGLVDVFGILLQILSPFVYGMAMAYLLKPTVNYFTNLFTELLPQKLHRIINPLSITLAFVVAGLSIYALFALIIPEFITSISAVIVTLPNKTNSLLAWVQTTFADEPMFVEYINTAYIALMGYLEGWESTLLPQITNILSGVGLGVVSVLVTVKNIIIGLAVAIYILSIRKKFARQGVLLLYGAFRKDWADVILGEIKYADNMFSKFINGKIIDSVIVGFLCYFVCLVVDFPTPTLISIIIGVTNVIPFFGPFIGAVPATILILLVDPIKAIWFVMFILILQQIDGNIIGPKILGDSTGLSSFWVLFSILFFGGIWGFFGMLVGVPLFAVLYDITRKLILYGLARNDCDDMLQQYNTDFGAPHVLPPNVKLSKRAARAAEANATANATNHTDAT